MVSRRFGDSSMKVGGNDTEKERRRAGALRLGQNDGQPQQYSSVAYLTDRKARCWWSLDLVLSKMEGLEPRKRFCLMKSVYVVLMCYGGNNVLGKLVLHKEGKRELERGGSTTPFIMAGTGTDTDPRLPRRLSSAAHN